MTVTRLTTNVTMTNRELIDCIKLLVDYLDSLQNLPSLMRSQAYETGVSNLIEKMRVAKKKLQEANANRENV